MKPIAIFYHVFMGGGDFPVDQNNVIRIVTDQVAALNVSGLRKAAQHFHIGVNGSATDAAMIQDIVGSPTVHNPTGTAELPTMRQMQLFCKDHPGWSVFYHHTKGAIHNGNPPYESWRHCMERTCVWRWQECVRMIELGADSSGVHWLTPERYPHIGSTAYWGGNFWWATSDFINTLPTIDITLSRYEAEVWIGRGPRRPKVRDLSPHFPMTGC